jgi:gliding motility-associated-like protein
MNQWLKKYFIVSFIFLCPIIQAKSNSSLLGIDKKWSKVAFFGANTRKAVIPVSNNFIATVDFTFTNDNTCSGTVIQFTSTVTGTGPYSYAWNFGDGTTSNVQDPNHSFTSIGVGNQNFNVSLTITDTGAGNATTTVSKTVVVKQSPDTTLNSDATSDVFNGQPVFKVCSSSTATITFANASTTATSNSSYKIDWGDSSPVYSIATNWGTVTHPYSIGFWNLTYTIVGQNGCTSVKTYTIFVGSNPGVALGSPGNTDICTGENITFPITGTINNPPGTKYTVSFNDGSSPEIFSHPPPTSITHVFAKSSCGTNSSDGTNTFNNSFSGNILAENPCGKTGSGIVPIYVSTKPTPDFTVPAPVKCTNSQVCFTNSSYGGAEAGSGSCITNAKIVWSITPAIGFTLDSGSSLGNDFGSNNPNIWTLGTSPLCVRFTTPGIYTIKMRVGNRCGVDEISKNICIESPLVPVFTLNTNTVCTTSPGNGDITVNNTTDESKSCNPPIYNWSVTYAASNCGTASNWNFTNGTNSTSKNPSFKFLNPGTYTLKLDAANATCGTFSTSQVIEVKQPPIVTISGPASQCGGYSATSPALPTATVQNCRPDVSTLTYLWSFPGGSPASSTSLNPGPIVYPSSTTVPVEYSIDLTVTNECGSTIASTYKFTLYPIPKITNTVLEQTICSGSTSIPVVLTSDYVRTPPDTYSWTATATAGITGFIASGTGDIPAQTISTTDANSGSVTYAITPLSFGCPGPVTNYVIKVDPLPYFTTQPADNGLCQGGITAPLQVVVNVTPTTYQWYSDTVNDNTSGTIIVGANSSTYIPPATLGTNYYYCTVTFAVGACTSITSRAAKVEVVILPTIDVQPLLTQNLCVGGVTQTPLTVHYINGSGAASYQWFTNPINSNSGGTPISNATTDSLYASAQATPGSYYNYVVITIGGSGCNTITSNTAEIVTVADPVFTSVIPLPNQEVCQTITGNPSNAFAWSVTVSGGLDTNGGTTDTFTYNYQWYLNDGSSPVTGANTAVFIPPTDQTGTFSYSCDVTQSNNRGCNVTTPFAQIKVNPQATITVNPASEDICFGGVFASLNIAYTGSFGTPQYQWFSNVTASNTGGAIILGATASSYTPTDVTTAVKYYYCEISFPLGGCATILSNFAILRVNQQTTIATQPMASQTLCVGGTTTLSVVPGFGAGTPTYQWYYNGSTNSNTGGVAVGTNNNSYTPPSFATAGTNYYYVTIQYSGNGCNLVTSSVAQIIVVPDPTITTQPIASQVICKDALPLRVVVTGGYVNGSYLYQWYSDATNSNTGGTLIAGATLDIFTPPNESPAEFSSITKYFYCEITQSGVGCGVTSNTSQVVTYPPAKIDGQPLSGTICLGQTTADLFITSHDGVRVTGSPTYQWYSNTVNLYTGSTLIPGAITDKYAPPVGVVGTNYYYCVISFLGGCDPLRSNIATITVNPVPVIAPKATATCDGVAFFVDPNNPIISGDIIPAGTVYTWSNPVISPTGTITGGSPQSTPQPSISQILTNTSENSATATYTVTPISGVPASCTGATFTVVVTVKASMYAHEVITNSKCFEVHNGSVVTNIAGGIPFGGAIPYIVSWTGPNGFISTATTITNLAPGVYHLNIKDNSGCKDFDKDYTVTEPADMLISTVTEKDITCFGYDDGAIDISINGGTAPYSYVWTKDGAAFAKTTEDISNLAPGVYEVTVSDANGCTPKYNPKTVSFTITQPDELIVTEDLSKHVNVKCYGDATGEIVVNAIGGTPFPVTNYTYAWTGPNGFKSSSQNLTSLYAGTYNLVVTDQSGCKTPLQVIITQNDEIIITPTVTAISCAGSNNGSISIVVTGGIPPYQYAWSNFANGTYQDNLAPGDYTVTVTDALLCVKVKTITVPVPPPFNINPVVSNISCFGMKDGSIALNINGGVPPVKVLWDDNPSAGSTRNNLAAGTYSVTISDGKPCVIKGSFVIVEPQPLVLTANLTNAFDCDSANSGAINLLVSGGTAPFTYAWSNGATTEDLVNIPAGNYLITVTDARGCRKQAEYVIYRQPPIVVVVDTKTDYNCDTHFVKQTFVANVSGGVPPYQLTWSSGIISGANNEIMNTNQNGAVTLTVVDGLGCYFLYTFDVKIPELGYPSAATGSYAYSTYGLYSVVDPIQFTNTSSGDFVSIAWNFGDGKVSTEISPTHAYLSPGQYTILQAVTYPFGCVYLYTLTLNVEKGYEFISPTAFTPNGDGINDLFAPQSLGMKWIHLEVYNTWGELIYSEKGETIQGWNGYVKNKLSENGNYFYKVTATTFYGTEIKNDGPFTLIN